MKKSVVASVLVSSLCLSVSGGLFAEVQAKTPKQKAVITTTAKNAGKSTLTPSRSVQKVVPVVASLQALKVAKISKYKGSHELAKGTADIPVLNFQLSGAEDKAMSINELTLKFIPGNKDQMKNLIEDVSIFVSGVQQGSGQPVEGEFVTFKDIAISVDPKDLESRKIEIVANIAEEAPAGAFQFNLAGLTVKDEKGTYPVNLANMKGISRQNSLAGDLFRVRK